MEEIGALNSVRLLLLASRRYRDREVGLEHHEIHSLAHRIEKNTNLFCNCDFRIGEKRVQSPQIDTILEMFDIEGCSEILNEDHSKTAGLYYQISREKDLDKASDIASKVSENVIDTVLSELKTLDKKGTEDYILTTREDSEKD